MDIEFDAVYGDLRKKVRLMRPSYGGDYQILIDNFIEGAIVRRSTGYAAYLNKNSDLTGDDLEILFQLLRAAEDQK